MSRPSCGTTSMNLKSLIHCARPGTTPNSQVIAPARAATTPRPGKADSGCAPSGCSSGPSGRGRAAAGRRTARGRSTPARAGWSQCDAIESGYSARVAGAALDAQRACSGEGCTTCAVCGVRCALCAVLHCVQERPVTVFGPGGVTLFNGSALAPPGSNRRRKNARVGEVTRAELPALAGRAPAARGRGPDLHAVDHHPVDLVVAGVDRPGGPGDLAGCDVGRDVDLNRDVGAVVAPRSCALQRGSAPCAQAHVSFDRCKVGHRGRCRRSRRR